MRPTPCPAPVYCDVAAQRARRPHGVDELIEIWVAMVGRQDLDGAARQRTSSVGGQLGPAGDRHAHRQAGRADGPLQQLEIACVFPRRGIGEPRHAVRRQLSAGGGEVWCGCREPAAEQLVVAVYATGRPSGCVVFDAGCVELVDSSDREREGVENPQLTGAVLHAAAGPLVPRA